MVIFVITAPMRAAEARAYFRAHSDAPGVHRFRRRYPHGWEVLRATESWVDPARVMSPIHPINVSTRMANRTPEIPARQLLDFEPRERSKAGPRYFDAKLGCWVLRKIPVRHTPPPRRLPPLPRGEGHHLYDVFDATTGARLGVIRGVCFEDADQLACDWAVSCGFTASDVEVRPHAD